MLTAQKRKIFISVVSLLLCLTLLITSSYAWVIISRAPEITGIQTRIGSNGSLEIALLNDTTYVDPSLIRSSVGDSMANQKATQSNLAWGNVVDLSDPSYGLDQIVMIPSRLNVADNGQGAGLVQSNMLGTMTFGSDGRTEKLRVESVSAVYTEEAFHYDSTKQNYGVRAIGPIPELSSQQSALTTARSLVKAHIAAATEMTKAAWSTDGGALLEIFQRRYARNSDRFNDKDLAALKDMATKVQTAYGYFDTALRQGIIGYAASEIADPELFQTLRENAENTAVPLSVLLSLYPGTIVPGFVQWVQNMESGRLELQAAIVACNSLRGGNYTWAQIAPIVNVLVNENRAYLGDYRLTSPDAYSQMAGSATLTLMPGSGRLAEAADYLGNYSVVFDYADNSAVEIVTTSNQSKPYLIQVSTLLDKCESADTSDAAVVADLESTYGFAMDLAFRSNADTKLLLQTESTARVNPNAKEDGEIAPELLGNGSSLSLFSEQLTEEQTVRLMDAMRIGFLDNQNNLLAVAKANTANYSPAENGVSAPLYLYTYEIGADGTLIMGERRTEDVCITSLTENVVGVITVVVWLDGDYVGNSLVSIRGKGIESTLNLQFASSVELKPVHQDVELPE